VPDGETLGDDTGVAGAWVGVAAGGLAGGSVFGSQAPNTATLAASTVDKINDLLIVFSFFVYRTRDACRPQRDIHTAGMMLKRLSANNGNLPSFTAHHQHCVR
jgi:hypothetical protein